MSKSPCCGCGPTGIGNLNFDLIYGLPLQTIASLRKTCEIVAMLSPDRIACYGYAHMPRLKANQRRIDESTLPGIGGTYRSGRGHRRGISAPGFSEDRHRSFCKARRRAGPGCDIEGRLHRNFQGYTDDGRETLIGSWRVLDFPVSGMDMSRIFPTSRAMFVRFRQAASRRRAAASWMPPKGSAPAPSKA